MSIDIGPCGRVRLQTAAVAPGRAPTRDAIASVSPAGAPPVMTAASRAFNVGSCHMRVAIRAVILGDG